MTDAQTMNMILGGTVKKTRKPSKPRLSVGKRVCAWGDTFGTLVELDKNSAVIHCDDGEHRSFIRSSVVVA